MKKVLGVAIATPVVAASCIAFVMFLPTLVVAPVRLLIGRQRFDRRFGGSIEPRPLREQLREQRRTEKWSAQMRTA